MVGAGIFVLPAIVAAELGTASVLAYVLGGVLIGLMMLCFAEIGSRITVTGGAPFDDPLLVAGQGGVGYETLEDVPGLDILIVPIGGGGLISGCAQIAKLLKPDIKVFGVEMKRAPAMKRSIEAGQRVTLDEIPIIIDGLTVKTVGAYTFEVCKELVDDILAIDEEQIFAAIPWIMERCKLVASVENPQPALDLDPWAAIGSRACPRIRAMAATELSSDVARM